jgi:hypothetical protein
MSTYRFNAEEDFIVRQSATMNVVCGVAMLSVFVATLISAKFSVEGMMMSALLFVTTGVFFIIRGLKKQELLKINWTGVYQHGALVCRWRDFHKAWLTQKEVTMSIKDNFVIMFQYNSADQTKLYTRTIRMLNTQDKADDEVIAAIRFYYENSQVEDLTTTSVGKIAAS